MQPTRKVHTYMINEVIVEGYIAAGPGNPGIWKFKKDTLFRLAVVREPCRPSKLNMQGNDEPDFITVRLPAEKFGSLPVALDKSKRIRVKGFLQSREYQETLATFLTRANGVTNMLSVSEEVARLITHSRVTTELIAETILQLDDEGGPQSRVFSSAAQQRAQQAGSSPAAGKGRARTRTNGKGNGNGNDPKAVHAQSPQAAAPAPDSAPAPAAPVAAAEPA